MREDLTPNDLTSQCPYVLLTGVVYLLQLTFVVGVNDRSLRDALDMHKEKLNDP